MDEQVHGPFARWIHRHEFHQTPQGTRLRDHVEFRLAGGVIADLLLGWAVRAGLWFLFRRRHRVTARYCETS